MHMSDTHSDQCPTGLDAPTRGQRMAALRAFAKAGLACPTPPHAEFTNCHIHTTYSFSPYTPAKAAYMAWASGLAVAGIMDHDSVAGADEFMEAGRVLGIATTVGIEMRCSFASTPFVGKLINNPDQSSVAYLALHGIPSRSLDAVERFAAPYRARRLRRCRDMANRANSVFGGLGIRLDFDRDVAGISQAASGGTVTERHILFALARKLIERHGAGEPLLSCLRGAFGVHVPNGLKQLLADAGDADDIGDAGYAGAAGAAGDAGAAGAAGDVGDAGAAGDDYAYRLLGLLKGQFIGMFYIDAADELPDFGEFIALAAKTGGIAAYAYLGDVRGSATGDKRDQAFEDGYLGDLIEWLGRQGFRAVTYVPARNTPAQLSRLDSICRANGLMQISGEDINAPFQPFACQKLAEPRYRHLAESAWALVGHGAAAAKRLEDGMFSHGAIAACPPLDERVARFAAIGRAGSPAAALAAMEPMAAVQGEQY